MAIRNIRIDGDEILRKKSKEVKEITPRITELIEDMFDTMREAEGVGLAAPQVGVLKRIFIVEIENEDESLCTGEMVFINPVILEEDGEQELDEGCLSLPGKAGKVIRPMKLICKAFDKNMQEFTIEADEYLARVISHESDHLEGILYKDKIIGELRDVEEVEAEEEEA